MADMNARLAKVELAIADRIDLFEEVGQSIEKLEVAQEELRGEMQGALNKVAESCASQGKDLKDSLASEVDAVRRNVASLREGKTGCGVEGCQRGYGPLQDGYHSRANKGSLRLVLTKNKRESEKRTGSML